MTDIAKKSLADSYADLLWERSTVPDHLWHYTDGAGLLGIANSRSLWCTEYRYLNDREEISTYAAQLQSYLRAALKDRLSSEDVDLIVGTSGLYAAWHVFVCSFCTDADRNEHWHQYAKKAGYALGFNPHTLRSLARTQGFALGPMIYGVDKALNIATAAVNDQLAVWHSFTSPLKTDERPKLSHFVSKLILSFAPFFKQESFQRENEWRLVKMTGIDDAGSIRASKPFGLISYYEFNFNSTSNAQALGTEPVPIDLIPRIIIGPGNETVGLPRVDNPYTLLLRSGFETLVSESKSSLRFVD